MTEKKKKSIYFQENNLERLDNEAKKCKRKRGDMLNRMIDFYFDVKGSGIKEYK